MTKQGLTYKDSGVDIAAGDALVKKISPMAKLTGRKGVIGGLGGFGGLFDLKAEGFVDPILVSGTDGVGTKLLAAIDSGKVDKVGIDLVAMCVNDILVQGAIPLFFLDYFATGRLDVGQAEQVIAGIAEGCKQAECALLGGETAEMPDFYDDKHFDLAGFCVGAVERTDMLPRPTIREGDILIGLSSSGFHSNGYSLVRKVLSLAGHSYTDICPWDSDKTIAESILEPTRIYVSLLKNLLKNPALKAMSHITGGGLTENIPRILPQGLNAEISLASWTMPACFKWMAEAGNISGNEMLTVFNCGIGMVLIIDKDAVSEIQDYFDMLGESIIHIGQITASDENCAKVVYV